MKKPGKQISIRLAPDLIEWIETEAKREQRSRNNYIALALKDFQRKIENLKNSPTTPEGIINGKGEIS